MIKKFCSIGLLLFLTGCGSSVSINDISIPDNKINAIVKAQEQIMGTVSSDQDKAIRQNVVNNLVAQTLLIQEAKRRGIQVPESDISTKYAETLNNWKTGGELQKSMKAQGFTESNMKDMVKDQLMIQALSDSIVTVTDEELANYFKIHSYEYATYTTQKVEGQSDKEATERLDPSKEVTLSFAQLPYQIQQKIQLNKLVLKDPQVIKINDKTYQAVNVTAVKNQTFEEVKEQVKQSFKSQAEMSKVQELLTQLKAQATIKTN